MSRGLRNQSASKARSGWNFASSRRDNPYRELGLTDDASDAEVDRAWRRLIAQYHPDKLTGAAEELRRQAETRARAINAAYDRIRTLRQRKD